MLLNCQLSLVLSTSGGVKVYPRCNVGVDHDTVTKKVTNLEAPEEWPGEVPDFRPVCGKEPCMPLTRSHSCHNLAVLDHDVR
jgi:hypothetical protein